MCPMQGSGSAAHGEISFLSWNSKVQHILASTSYNGTTVVWDLKKQKLVISFSDSVRRRSSVLQWNPDVATQLVVASDEDSSPSVRRFGFLYVFLVTNDCSRPRILIVKCNNLGQIEGSGGNLKDALAGIVDKQVGELLNREENRVLLDGLDKASQRVEMAKKELAEIEKQ
ncbi:protein transport protein sec31 like protein b [Quercus suber]|uniref:Protein transport protein sec31 like protein b n=1 Tax=Quercus suber TaxID=58331 RepID=A0AAW0LGS4_QUESU